MPIVKDVDEFSQYENVEKKMKIIPLKICLIWNRLTFVKISEGLKSSNIRATHNQFTKMF